MSSTGHRTGAQIRAQLSHPVIDADGHWLEFGPLVREELRRIGGDKAVEGFSMLPKLIEKHLVMSVAERREQQVAQQAFWSFPTKNTRDRATAIMPRLLYERMDELGFDFSVMYPTGGGGLPMIPDPERRHAACRAFNIFSAEYFAEFSDRITPVALIPMHTPEEAIEEIEYVTSQLGLKVVMLGSLIQRNSPAPAAMSQNVMGTLGWRDVLGLDSAYEYDPVWAKCVECKVSPTFHSGSRGIGLRLSPSNFVYNHIGHFAAASEAVCKALFLGGVTRRFPQLKFAFLEGGVGWACQLYVDLIEHWEKRKLEALEEVNPKNLDTALLVKLAETYGDPKIADALQNSDAAFDTAMPPKGSTEIGGIDTLDDFAACQIERVEDFRDLFVKNFYFGCEVDDRMNAWAFSRRNNPLDSQLNALMGSDIGHFDVADMAGVLAEAYEQVEDGLMNTDAFRDFTFTNPVRFWGEANPDFFKGTVVEAAAARVLADSTPVVGRNGSVTAQAAK
jgi:predicted TIM-barrel fold metal-dependent hydrolase